jgi:hypothetical protein
MNPVGVQVREFGNRKGGNMKGLRKLPLEFPVEELDRELIARGAQIPGKKRFKFRACVWCLSPSYTFYKKYSLT